jgi:hypothetical protein
VFVRVKLPETHHHHHHHHVVVVNNFLFGNMFDLWVVHTRAEAVRRVEAGGFSDLLRAKKRMHFT